MSVIRQLSLFGAEASPPQPEDLAGLLIAGGEIQREGEQAQVTIVVGHPWRAAALVAECGRRSIAATSVSTPDSYVGVRTAYTASLLPLARAWTDVVGRRPPRGLRLDARILRLWAIAVGYRDGLAYVLPIVEPDQGLRDAIGSGLADLGLAAQLASPRGRGAPTFRIVGKRRFGRLVELVGEAPRHAPVESWPS